MKTDFKQQEILLMINTSFSGRQWVQTNGKDDGWRLSNKEQLKVACWNGMAPEMLPECFENGLDREMILWEINDANAFIDLEYGEYVPTMEKHQSVNPYVFMEAQVYN